MVRRQIIAWTVSGISVAGTAGLTVHTVGLPSVPPAVAAATGAPVVVYEDRYVDDVVAAAPVTDAGTTPAAAADATEAPVDPAADPATDPAASPVVTAPATAPAAASVTWSAVPASTSPPGRSGGEPVAAPAPAPAPTTGVPAAPTTTRPAPTTPRPAPTTTRATTTTTRPVTTTTAPSSTTTLPPGARVPSDWPPGVPYPPIPPGCRKPVLEDNGVWNCEH